MSMLETLSQMLVLGDAMDGLINTGIHLLHGCKEGQWLVQRLYFAGALIY